jgi:ubiquinone/menaquinone biosynthesis C-methylase UbiE
VYAGRSETTDPFKYSVFNTAQLFLLQQRQRGVIEVLQRCGITHLTQIQHLLEVGCGDGAVLLEYGGLGIPIKSLHGSDVLPGRVTKAHTALPTVPFTCADGRALPYRSNSFDLVAVYTVMSSILDEDVQHRVARELMRVVKRDGIILCYDFWLNPNNPNTRGVTRADLQRWFPDSRMIARRITLAPPISRRLVKHSWWLGTLLESLRVFNTHDLVAILPEKRS